MDHAIETRQITFSQDRLLAFWVTQGGDDHIPGAHILLLGISIGGNNGSYSCGF